MDLSVEEARQILKRLLDTQSLAVLATRDNAGHPYCNLVAFASCDEMKSLLFATPRTTQKYKNLSFDTRVALLVDSRNNEESDFHDASAATALGTASELTGSEWEEKASLYLAKHPHLKEFVSSPTCALFRVTVETFYVVTRFQTVMKLQM